MSAPAAPLPPLSMNDRAVRVLRCKLFKGDRRVSKDDRRDVLRILGFRRRLFWAYWRAINWERTRCFEFLGWPVDGKAGTRRIPMAADWHQAKERLSAALEKLRTLAADPSQRMGIEGSASMSVVLTASTYFEGPILDAAKEAMGVYLQLNDFVQRDIDNAVSAAPYERGSLIGWIDIIRAALETHRPRYKAIARNHIPRDMITQIARIFAEAGGPITRSGYKEHRTKTGFEEHRTKTGFSEKDRAKRNKPAEGFERLLEIGRLYSGHAENDAGDVHGWLRNVVDKAFCERWNEWPKRQREAIVQAQVRRSIADVRDRVRSDDAPNVDRP